MEKCGLSFTAFASRVGTTTATDADAGDAMVEAPSGLGERSLDANGAAGWRRAGGGRPRGNAAGNERTSERKAGVLGLTRTHKEITVMSSPSCQNETRLEQLNLFKHSAIARNCGAVFGSSLQI